MNSNSSISSAAVSDRGLSDKRPQNEDSYLEMTQCGIYAVADGVGGAQAGEVASQMAVEIIGEAFANLREGDDPERIMRVAIGRANSAIHQMAQELPQLASMATTVVALHLAGNIATIGHVGDSRLYRVDVDGNLFAETEDHSMVAEEVRAGRMTAEQAENHPSKNIISRALGAEPSVDVDLKTIMVAPGTAFLICSDGITRHVNDDEIKGVLTFGGEPRDVCEYLRGLCYERGAEDNLTAVVIRIAKASAVVTEDFPLSLSDAEEPTIASPRLAPDPLLDDDDDDLLELDTIDLAIPETTLEMPYELDSRAITIPNEEPDQIESTEAPDAEINTPAPVEVSANLRYENETSSIFGDTESVAGGAEPSALLAKVATLALGSLIGLGVYHYALAPKPVDLTDPKLSVMKTDDIAFSSFEKLRRSVDTDPAAYIKEVPPADDAEDYYLIGRAYLLVGDFPKARLALIEAQKQIEKVDPANAKILNTDIATALLITNDPTIQNRFKRELEATQGQK